MKSLKKAFTLLELLIVIAIIAALMGIMLKTVGGTDEAARSVQCFANMKNLSAAVQAYVAETSRYPLAGSVEMLDIDLVNGNARKTYSEMPGWISWNSRCTYRSKPQSHVASSSWFTSAYNQDYETRQFALTNGALWKAVGNSPECYVCPSHVIKMPSSSKPCWSYVMNSYFGWDTSEGSKATASNDPRKLREYISRADKRILFAELQWSNLTGESPDTSSGPGINNDCVLQYGDRYGETIGFNHKSGRDICAHVIFADGHTDNIVWKDGMNVKDLTKWLCEGADIDAANGQYREMK